MDFMFVDAKAGIAGYRQLHHFQAVLGRSLRLTAMRRGARGQQAHFVQAQRLAQFFGQTQVAVMDGVEGTAEKADGLSHT